MKIIKLIYKLRIKSICKSMFKFNIPGRMIPIIWSRYYLGFYLDNYKFINNRLELLFTNRSNSNNNINIQYEYDSRLIIYINNEQVEEYSISLDEYKRIYKLVIIAYNHMTEEYERVQNMFRFR